MAAHRTEFIIFEHRYVVLGPNPANLECVHMIIKYHMCSSALLKYAWPLENKVYRSSMEDF